MKLFISSCFLQIYGYNYNKKLLRAVEKSKFSMEEIAILSGIYEDHLISIIAGRDNPDQATRDRIAVILNKKEGEIF